jgi:ribosomal protein S18 acetylase RimI-like enzyme
MQPAFPALPAGFAAQGLSLRPATPADSAFQRDVYVAARWQEMAVAGWPEDVMLAFLHDQYRLQTLHYDRYYPDAARLIVECRGMPAGRLILLDRQTDLRIVDIALLPDFRGQGTGGMLLRWVQDLIRGRNESGKVSLHVEPGNPARRLYQRLGFREMEIDGAYMLMEWEMGGPDRQPAGTGVPPQLTTA